MRICILTHTFPRFDGDTAAPFMQGVAEGMAQNGAEVFVLTPNNPQFKNVTKKRSYKLLTYKYFWGEFQKMGYSNTLSNDMGLKPFMVFLSPFMIFFGILALIKLVREKKIDVINAHWILPNGFIASVVSLITKTPVVSTLPGSDVYMAKKNLLFKSMALFASRISRLITSNSPQLLTDLKKIGADEKKFQTVLYGVNPKKFFPGPKSKNLLQRFQIKKGQTVVVGVGRLVEKKGFRYLIRAAEMLKDRDIKIIIVGEGDESFYLKNLVKQLNLQSHVSFAGQIDYKRLISFYNLADIFVLPSIRDDQGNLDDQSVSVIEAMACGKPIITTNFPGYKLVVKDSVNGYLTSEKHTRAIAEALMKLLKDKKKTLRMGKKSREIVLNEFSWKAIGKQYIHLFGTIKKRNQTYYSENISKILDPEDRLRVARQITAVLKKDIGNLKPLNCLDIGCSSGVITNFLAGHFKSITGVDIDQQAIDIAKSHHEKNNLRYFVTDAEKLEFKDESFDIVVLNQVYNFVDHPKKLMDEIYRVLKPGGKVFFSARNKLALVEPQYRLPFLSWLPENLALKYLEVFKKSKIFFGKNYMSMKQLQELVSKFHITNYTVSILRNPIEYKFSNLRKYATLAKIIPIEKIEFLIPNFIWILEKPKD